MQSEVAQERRDGRARADHGQPPRGAPQPRGARARLRGPRRGLDLRQPYPGPRGLGTHVRAASTSLDESYPLLRLRACSSMRTRYIF